VPAFGIAAVVNNEHSREGAGPILGGDEHSHVTILSSALWAQKRHCSGSQSELVTSRAHLISFNSRNVSGRETKKTFWTRILMYFLIKTKKLPTTYNLRYALVISLRFTQNLSHWLHTCAKSYPSQQCLRCWCSYLWPVSSVGIVAFQSQKFIFIAKHICWKLLLLLHVVHNLELN